MYKNDKNKDKIILRTSSVNSILKYHSLSDSQEYPHKNRVELLKSFKIRNFLKKENNIYQKIMILPVLNIKKILIDLILSLEIHLEIQEHITQEIQIFIKIQTSQHST